MATKSSKSNSKPVKKGAISPAARKAAAPKVQLSGIARKPVRPGGLGRGLDALIGREQTRNVAAVDPSPALPTADPLSPANATPAVPSVASSPIPEIPAQASVVPEGRRVFNVAIAQVVPSPWQPRKNFDSEEAQRSLEELASSIRVHGVIQPLVCRKADGGFFELIGGERRLRAARMAGLDSVPVLLLEAADRDAAEMALVENLQREDLNVVEQAEAYRALIERFSLTQEEVAERVGKGRTSITNALRLLDLPDDVKQLLGGGELSLGHAKAILGAEGDAQRIALASECVRTGMSVRALEKRVASLKAAPARRPPIPDVDANSLADISRRMHARFATAVRIFPSATFANGRHSRGHIEIDFDDNGELSRLLELFGIDVNNLDD